MRFSSSLWCLTILFLSPLAADVHAQEGSFEVDWANARRELTLASMEFRDYWQVDYPRIRRDLDARIELTEEEVRNYNLLLREYMPFDRFSTGSAFVVPLQDLRMCKLEAELRLKDLRAERNNLVRFRTPEWRALELRVHDARMRVAHLEAQAERFKDGAR